MKSALDFLRADPSIATSFKDAERIVAECAAEALTRIDADLTQRGTRLA